MPARPVKTHRFQYGDLDFTYSVIVGKRRTVAVQIYPGGRVVVRTPPHTAHDLIEAVLVRRVDWLRRHYARLAALPVPQITAVVGEGTVFRWLGNDYAVRVQIGKVEAVKMEIGAAMGSPTAFVLVTAKTPDRAPRVIERWYRAAAHALFEMRLLALYEKVRGWGVPLPVLRVRVMRARWGSCSAGGAITLNLHLARQPLDLIDYVILHELCHLRELNHSAAFYALMDEVCPGWRALRQRIKNAVI